MHLPARVKVVEVGPRDGLQNEPAAVSVAAKVALINALVAGGLRFIEAGSFVSPARVPQMADTEAVLGAVRGTGGGRDGVRLSVLTPNMTGFEAARRAGADEVAVFAAASETFSRRNINCSIDESLDRFQPVCAAAAAGGIPVRGYVSCVLGCPYEGDVAADAVARVAERLLALGCSEISLGDTIGRGTPARARALVERVAVAVPMDRIAVHFHDTYGQALANILAVLDLGVAAVDSSVAGLGGCPYAEGATGNVATEDVVYMMDGLGIETGVDLAAVARAGWAICGELGRRPSSRVALALGDAGP